MLGGGFIKLPFLTIVTFLQFFSTSIFAQAAAPDIKIGAIFPMTGPMASFGQESVNGIKLALADINAQGGVQGRKIDLILEDDKGEPIDASNAARKLIEVDGVKSILGSVASSNTLAAAPIAQKAKIPLITPASTNEKVTKMGDYISRICFTDDFQGVVMAKFAHNDLKKSKAAILVDSSSDYSKGLASVFSAQFKKLGGTVIPEDFAYQQRDVEFRSLLRKVKRTNPDVIFIPGYYSEVGLMIKQARQMGMTQPILGGDGWDSPNLFEVAGKAVENTFISSHFASDDTSPEVVKFVTLYTQKYKEAPGAMAALGHDSMLFLAQALKKVKNLNSSDEIKVAINSMKDMVGVTGKISMDAERNAIKSAVVLEFTEKGKKFKQKVNP